MFLKQSYGAGLLLLSCLLAQTLVAQTQIGGGACNSSSLTGTYAFSLTGRQVSASGTFTAVLQANGSATFDGTNKFSLAMTAGTIQAVNTPLTYSGTYSIQSNCAGAISITAGDSATFNLVVYNQGNAFLVTGTDATYSYTGGGNTQPSGCLASLLSGVYTFNATGYGLSTSSVTGIREAAGLLQFDGRTALTVNLTLSAAGQTPAALVLTGTYTISSACVGTASLTDSQSNTYSLSFSVSGGTSVNSTALELTLAQTSKLLISGAAHAVYGQPTADRRIHRSRNVSEATV
jgi:hypothetical protein